MKSKKVETLFQAQASFVQVENAEVKEYESHISRDICHFDVIISVFYAFMNISLSKHHFYMMAFKSCIATLHKQLWLLLKKKRHFILLMLGCMM